MRLTSAVALAQQGVRPRITGTIGTEVAGPGDEGRGDSELAGKRAQALVGAFDPVTAQCPPRHRLPGLG